MTEITSLLKAYIETKATQKELDEQVKNLKTIQSERVKSLVELTAELGEMSFEFEGQQVHIGYDTTYTSIGGEFKNPALRRELFTRISEATGSTISDKIVFKDNFLTGPNGEIYECKDADISGTYFQKLIKSLDPIFREQLIKDGLLGFYTVPKVEVE